MQPRALLLIGLVVSACPGSIAPTPISPDAAGAATDASPLPTGPDASAPDGGSSDGGDAGSGEAGTPDAATCLAGAACDDGDPCTLQDECASSGDCRGTAKVCASSGSDCTEAIGTCDPTSGECIYGARPADWRCSDGDECTVGDLCDGLGTCVGGTPTACQTTVQCRLSQGACDPTTGRCSFAVAPSGTSCEDGEPCTEPDACDSSGTCVSGPLPACEAPPDTCHRALGHCDSEAGGCVYDLRPAGSSCSDGDPCTLGDSCLANGICVPGGPLTCDLPPLCSELPGSCVPGAGCVYPPSLLDTPCADGDLCRTGGRCDGAGTCVAQERECPSAGSCAPGICDPADGQCRTNPLVAGTPCEIPNATAACDGAGSCAVATCDAGFVPFLGGCSSFGGGFQTNDSACLSCGAPNALASGCACPAGFTDQRLRSVSDCAGEGTYVGTWMHLCQAAAFSGETDYGGAWQEDLDATCGAGCRSPNPVTGACSCPNGTVALVATALTDSVACPTEILGTRIALCVNTSAPITRFGGAYQVDDTAPSGLTCRAPNPRTGACSCPAGTSVKLRVRLKAGSGSIDVGSNLHLCSP
ncbi:MAG: hypothetical protein HY901_32685 [Deltaproteobacteria bacterium]|nr:hypothetical protein [Deltaproteobacteria bacterium]